MMGTLGTVYLTGENEGMLYKEGETRTTEVSIDIDKETKKPILVKGDSTLKPSGGLPSMSGSDRFKAYGYEITRFAEAVRTGNPSLLGCSGQDGRKAAIAVFASNEAIRTNSIQPCSPPDVVAVGPKVQ